MVVAVPLLGGRVAPRCTTADRLLLVTVRGRQAEPPAVLDAAVDGVESLLEIVGIHAVRVLVCGGITGSARERLEARGVRVIGNVTGSVAEVLAAIRTGTLRSGFGFGRDTGGGAAARRAGDAWPMDCVSCSYRSCEEGLPCPFLPAGMGTPAGSRKLERLLLVASVGRAPGWSGQCRIAQLVRFALRAGFAHIGVAFCVDLRREAEVLTGILQRYFRVLPVTCTIRGSRPPGFADAPPGHRCNAVLQARVLNTAGTDLNLIVGLDVGADAVFAAASRAPVSTLLVKDTALGHNPLAALHSGHYLRQCTMGAREPRSDT